MKNLKIIILSILITITINAKEPLIANQIQGKLNIINGASAECVMHYFYKSSGWTQLEGEIGRNGIDGLYLKKKSNHISELLVTESKWNKSKLSRSGKNKTIKQMSQEWIINTIIKLEKRHPSSIYNTLKNLIKHNQYRARLFTLKPKKNNKIQIAIFKIQNKGLKSFTMEKYRELKAIDLNAPKNDFETNILHAYNSCREKYLKKYIPILTEQNIKTLLEDNYLQKRDIIKLLP